MIVIKKNRSEKGRRWLEFLSNPHSKGEDFSRFNLTFFLSIRDRSKTIILIIKIVGVNNMIW